MKVRPTKTFLLSLTVTSLLVAFFVAQTSQADSELIIDYFNKAYFPDNTVMTEINSQPTTTTNEFGIINWLPGEEFEIFLNKKSSAGINNIPLDNTPEYIIANLYKQIELAQKPTAEELQQEITATVIEHNLPVAVLNVWRPHAIIKIKNLSNQTWQQDQIMLTSENFSGNLSFFRDPSWQTNRKITTMKESSVAPGETATFEFLIDGRGQPHVYDHVYKLIYNNQTIHLDAKGALYWLTRVDAYEF